MSYSSVKGNSVKSKTKSSNSYRSDIYAIVHVSESEIKMFDSEYSFDKYEQDNKRYDSILWDLGIDTNFRYEVQDVTQHRNRLGQVVIGRRFYGEERSDEAWVSTRLASQAVKDKISASRLVDEMYMIKGLTRTAQLAGELKDSYEIEDKIETQKILDKEQGWSKEIQGIILDSTKEE